MRYIYCFEVVGTVLFRPSGNAGFPPVECVIVETRAQLRYTGGVIFHELSTGHDWYHFPSWFADWKESDNATYDGENGFQAGKPVEIAIPRVAYDEILRTGKYTGPPTVIGGDEATQLRLMDRVVEEVRAPIAAVKIDGLWIAPLEASSGALEPAFKPFRT